MKLDLSGQVLVPVGYTYDKPSYWSDRCEGQIKVYAYLEEPHNDSFISYGVIDYQGNTIVPVIYDRVITCAFDSKLILVRQYENGSKYHSLDGLYNSWGEQLLPVKYETIRRTDYSFFEAYTKEEQSPELYHYDPATQQLTPTEREWVEYEISVPEME
ncbi:MAG: WG repeat-containing protein [Bacteroides sp.]|nr:WG repeat-containing protein [Bacteroides sp.]